MYYRLARLSLWLTYTEMHGRYRYRHRGHALLFTDPQVDALKPEGVMWDKVGDTVKESALKNRRLGYIRLTQPLVT